MPGIREGSAYVSCTPEGTRTPNSQIRNLMLYPLSYGRLKPRYTEQRIGARSSVAGSWRWAELNRRPDLFRVRFYRLVEPFHPPVWFLAC